MWRSFVCRGKIVSCLLLVVLGVSCLILTLSIQASPENDTYSELIQEGAIGIYSSSKQPNKNTNREQSFFESETSTILVPEPITRHTPHPVQKQVQPPVEHVFFRKVHKAASSVVQNILFRYGYTRKKNFVLSPSGNYITSHRDIVPIPREEHYDILCNHVTAVSHNQLSKILPEDIVHIAIVRNPFERLVSAFYYYQWESYIKRIRGQDPLLTYLQDPLVYEPKDPTWSRTNNKMMQDFGYRIYEPKNIPRFNKFIKDVNSTFTLVLVSERLDESLVVLRRLLRWSVKDILYFSHNINTNKKQSQLYNTTKANETVLKFDNILYEFFAEKLEYEMRAAGEDFNDEVFYFQKMRIEVVNYCLGNLTSLYVPRCVWHDGFLFTSSDCSMLLRKELDFIDMLRKYQWTKIFTRQ